MFAEFRRLQLKAEADVVLVVLYRELGNKSGVQQGQDPIQIGRAHGWVDR